MPKLTVELIPKSCHFSNVRSMVTPYEWDKIRKLSYEKANHKCEICGNTGLKQGFKHAVECHEIWHYDDENKIQKLTGLISLCVLCHQVKHIGRAIAIGNQVPCFNHLARVNKWTQEQVHQHIVDSFKVHTERSKYKWTLDISLLKNPPYNITINESEERKFNEKPYKKKVKKKSGPKKKHPSSKIGDYLKKPTNNKRPPKKT